MSNGPWNSEDYLAKTHDVQMVAKGPDGKLPITDAMMKDDNIGTADLFMMGQERAMGVPLTQLGGDKDFLILSTQGGLRGPKGENVASGLHIGHWELGIVASEAAKQFTKQGTKPLYVNVSDPCDGRTQGKPAMANSLPWRNMAAMTMRSLIEQAPTRKGVMGIASCDKGVPATLMALAEMHNLPTIFVPGGVSLPTEAAPHLGAAYAGGVHAGLAQSIKPQYLAGQITLDQAQEIGCKACGTPGGGCQFLGTAATSQVVAEALGMTLPHSALVPSGQEVWLDIGRGSADALINLQKKGITTKDILTDDAIYNAMVVHAAFGGSTNLLMHVPAIAHAAGVRVPTRDDWEEINAKVPRLVDVLPNSEKYKTVDAFMAGGVPEVMLHLRDLGLLKTNVMTVTGKTLGENLDEWAKSPRRAAVRKALSDRGINPDDVICPPEIAKQKNLTTSIVFPTGNLSPDGSVIKTAGVDQSVIGKDPLDSHKEGTPGVYHKIGRARIFLDEKMAMKAINAPDGDPTKIKAGDVMVLMGIGPQGLGMPETFQITRALKDVKWGKEVALLTDGRFSGVSTGACIGHIGPEAVAGGPLGKIKDGDVIEIKIRTNQAHPGEKLTGSINFVGTDINNRVSPEEGARILAGRPKNPDLKPHPSLPRDVQLWGSLQNACGGTWGGCVWDEKRITELLNLGLQKERETGVEQDRPPVGAHSAKIAAGGGRGPLTAHGPNLH